MLPKSNVRGGRSDDDPAAGNRKEVVFVSSDYMPASYPDDVVNHRHIIIHEELPENALYGSELQVYVRKVTSPSEFWINISGVDYSRKLVALYADMRQFYEENHDRYLLPSYAVLIGQFCVCIYRNEWHRARIVNAADKNLVDVFLIDSGGTVTVCPSSLRFMHKKFSCLPMQSFRADLPDIKPKGGAEWPISVCQFFREETFGKKFYAKVVNVGREEHSVSLKLLDVGRISVSEKLLSNNMADANTQDFDAPATRNEGSIGSSLDASSVEVEDVKGIQDDASSYFEDDSTLPEVEATGPRSADAPVTGNTWRNVDLKDVTVAGKRLLLVTIKGKSYFVLSDFLDAFSVLHEHVVLKVLETLPSRVVVEKMGDRDVRVLLGQLRGRRIRGVTHLANRGITPCVHLLPVGVAGELLAFLGEDCNLRTSLHNFVSTLS